MEKSKGRPRRKRFTLNRGYPFSFISPHPLETCVGRLNATPAYRFDPYVAPNFDRMGAKQLDTDHYVFRIYRRRQRGATLEVRGVMARVGQETYVRGRTYINGNPPILLFIILLTMLAVTFSGGPSYTAIVIFFLAFELVTYFIDDSARHRFYEDVLKMFDGREQLPDSTEQKKT